MGQGIQVTDRRGQTLLQRTGRLKVGGVEISGVRCEIDLPMRNCGAIEPRLEWSSSASPGLIPGVGTFEFDTKVDTLAGYAHERLRLLDMHVASILHAMHGREALDVSARARAGALERIRFLSGNSTKRTGSAHTALTLFLTPIGMLRPWRTAEFSYTGEVRYSKKRVSDAVSVSVPRIGNVAFDNYFEWESDERGDMTSSRRYQVANVKIDIPATNSEAILSDVVAPLEDLLLLASFASRTPTRCAGWLATDDVAVVEYYRRQVALPSGKQRYRTITNGGLVELKDFRRFLVRALSVFGKTILRTEIRQAIYALNNSPEETIEHRFVSLFTAFDALVVAIVADASKARFKRDARSRKAIQEELLRQLNGWVKTKRISDEVRRQFAKQIGAIQSISLTERYKILDKVVRFKHDDLWPITARGNTRSLYVLRNRLAHGSSFEERHFDSLVTAGYHMEWLLERLLCAVFKWPLGETDLSVTALPAYWGTECLDWVAAERFLRE